MCGDLNFLTTKHLSASCSIVISYLMLIIALVLNASGSILLKIGSSRIGNLEGLSPIEIGLRLLGNVYLLIGLSVFALNVVFYIAALSRLNLSIAYPIMVAGGILIITLFSYFILKENLTIFQIVGIALIAIGISLVTYKTA